MKAISFYHRNISFREVVPLFKIIYDVLPIKVNGPDYDDDAVDNETKENGTQHMLELFHYVYVFIRHNY